MSAPVRVQLSRAKGWRLPANTVNVARPSRWGNFYRVGESMCRATIRRWGHRVGSFRNLDHVCADRIEAVRKFEGVLAFDEAIWPELRKQLAGKNLACWCPLDQPCHADVLLAVANSGGAA